MPRQDAQNHPTTKFSHWLAALPWFRAVQQHARQRPPAEAQDFHLACVNDEHLKSHFTLLRKLGTVQGSVQNIAQPSSRPCRDSTTSEVGIKDDRYLPRPPTVEFLKLGSNIIYFNWARASAPGTRRCVSRSPAPECLVRFLQIPLTHCY